MCTLETTYLGQMTRTVNESGSPCQVLGDATAKRQRRSDSFNRRKLGRPGALEHHFLNCTVGWKGNRCPEGQYQFKEQIGSLTELDTLGSCAFDDGPFCQELLR